MKVRADSGSLPGLDQLPVLGVCGASGAGKTTLIEKLIPRLLAMNLKVAVIKHDARKVEVDRPGKDSDRFFRQGADVFLTGDEQFCRFHHQRDLATLVPSLCLAYDLVLVEGHAKTPVPKIWLLGRDHATPPAASGECLQAFARSPDLEARVARWLGQWLEQRWAAEPVYGCVLIGGKSRRMGRPKHLLSKDGQTWLERAVSKLERKVERVVISGEGEVPESLVRLPRIADAPGVAGPMAGLLGIMRWLPYCSWLVTACDQPDIETGALDWLLAARKPGVWGVLPDLRGNGRVEPLLALYGGRVYAPLLELTVKGCLRPGALALHPKVITPRPPRGLAGSWRNVNRWEEIGG